MALFLGCTAELADAETVTAAIRLLTRLGVSITVPSEQGCCGGMALHNGDGKGFAKMKRRNLLVFQNSEFDTVLTFASGCGAVLKEYESHGFNSKFIDISNFLAELSWPDNIFLESLSAKVIVHSPCSLKNVMKSDRHPIVLLKQIPGIHVESLIDVPNCCGAAGTYLLNHPEMAHALREDFLVKIKACSPDFIATSNVGCAMHLRAGLKQNGMGHVQVLHPLVLLERQLAVKSNNPSPLRSIS